MKLRALVLACGGLLLAATVANAQKAPAAADPLADAQGAFGSIVGDAFHRPDAALAASSGPASPARAAGIALRDSMVAPGAVFAGLLKPFADADPMDAAPAAPAPQPRRHVRVRHRHLASRT